MWSRAYYTGRNIGWEWAGSYARGTKAERREIRRKLARMASSDNHLVAGIWDGFADRAEQIGETIRKGMAKRTIRPGKLEGVLERVA